MELKPVGVQINMQYLLVTRHIRFRRIPGGVGDESRWDGAASWSRGDAGHAVVAAQFDGDSSLLRARECVRRRPCPVNAAVWSRSPRRSRRCGHQPLEDRGLAKEPRLRHDRGVQQSPYLSWVESLDFLRNRLRVPAALSNATTLVAARARWGQHVHCRTSMHDLVFTVPGDKFPFTASVVVHVDGSRHVVRRTVGGHAHEVECTAADIDRVVDEALEALRAPAQVCRACGALSAGADFAAVFERMHYVCFHFEYEHGDTDRDQTCRVPGCPVG